MYIWSLAHDKIDICVFVAICQSVYVVMIISLLAGYSKLDMDFLF